MTIKSVSRPYQLLWETEPHWPYVQLELPTGNDTQTVKRWLHRNATGDVTVHRPFTDHVFSVYRFYFEVEADALIFKLTFGDFVNNDEY